MSRAVWKFPLAAGVTHVTAPVAARPVLVALDPATGDPALWLEVDPEAGLVRRAYALFATGQRIDGDGGYPSPYHVGSVVHGAFVWHAYELRGEDAA